MSWVSKERNVAKAQVAGKKQPFVLVRLMRETVAELRKVNWPTRREATNLTIIVVIALAATSTILGLLDFLFSQFFKLVLSLV
jgi:preprotein translocase SecE subunit